MEGGKKESLAKVKGGKKESLAKVEGGKKENIYRKKEEKIWRKKI